MGDQWFHVTRTWRGPQVWVQPMGVRADDEHNPLDCEPCICVSPTIAQCLVAVGDWRDLGTLRVYRTTGRPVAAKWVFDYPVTKEHRFYRGKTFEFVREFQSDDLAVAVSSLVGNDELVELGGLDCIPLLEYKLNIYTRVLGKS